MSQNLDSFLSSDMEDYIWQDVKNIDMTPIASMMLEGGNNFLDTAIENESIVINGIVTHAVSQNVLSKERYHGPYNFSVEIANGNNGNNGYLFSDDLNKLYSKMDQLFQVGLKVNFSAGSGETFFVRTTLVYSQPQFAQEHVYRCINHAYSDKGDEHTRQHILRCANGNAQYVGGKEQNERLSVVIPLSHPQTGSDCVIEMYHFVCQNSCPTPGMNRRPVEMIFSLEDAVGTILGRQTFHVRVCCSPKRDMMKDLKELRERGDLNLSNKGKKRKITDKKVPEKSEVDTTLYEITLKIPGKHNVQATLKYVQDLMAGEMVKYKNKAVEETFRLSYEDVSSIIKPLE